MKNSTTSNVNDAIISRTAKTKKIYNSTQMTEKEITHWLDKAGEIDASTPFKITDLSIMVDNIKLLKEHLPDIDIYYAVKSAFSPEIINAVDRYVSGYDIASHGEFKELKKLGITSDRVVYSNPVKVPVHIDKTFKNGVEYYAFDSIEEIKKLAEYAPGANVYLRIRVSDYGSKFPLSSKFGVDPLHAVAYFDTAQEYGLNPCGLAFHVGSQSENPHTWAAAFEVCGDIIKRIEKNGDKVTLLNIGGGFPVVYTERIADIEQIAKTIKQSIKKYIPQNVRIIAEPGRYVSANASVIVTSIIGKEFRGSSEWLFLDMGVFQGLMESLQMPNWKYPIFAQNNGHATSQFTRAYTLTGPTCDAYDTIGLNYELPSSLIVGDRLFIGAAGAYTTVYASNFNGFEPPKEHYIESEAETI